LSRSRSRVCLQDGLKLDLNRLAQRGFIKFGSNIGSRGIAWNHSYWGEVANGVINADMSDPYDAWMTITFGNSVQRIILEGLHRHYGGRQWFFVCPATNRRATVLWKPPGATRFCSRQTWGRQVAYSSQYLDRDSRAHAGQSKIRSRLCSIGKFDPDEWDMPPKPKWMRWKTYNRHVEKFDRYEDILDYGCAALAAKLAGLKIL
jgi:hypothetical protein